MKLHALISARALSLSVLDVRSWPDIESSLLDKKSFDRYKRFKQAITRIVRDHCSTSAAASESGIDRSELGRALERCLEPADDGNIEGFRALIFYRHLQPYKRRPGTATGTAGLMEDLLDKFPEIADDLWSEYKKGESIATLARWLRDELLPSVGYPTHRYPYNTIKKGDEALRQYLKKQKIEKVSSEWEEWGYSDENRVIIRPFQRVQLDAHRCDAIFVVHIEGPDGLPRTEVLQRIWLLVLFDVASRSTIGYSLSLNEQIDIPDVLEVIHRAMFPQPQLPLTIPGLEYKPEAALPNQIIPICEFIKFDQITLDNAMAHRSPKVHEILNQRIQCSIRLNRSGTPNDNPFIERFFGTLTAHGFQRTPSTTGSGPTDPRRQKPEEKAVQFEFTQSDGEELLAVLIANSNVEMHRSISSTPLDYLRNYYNEMPAMTRHVPASKRESWSLREIMVKVTVKGDVRKNKRPFVRYLEAEYRSKLLVSNAEMINKELIFVVNFDDLRSVKAYHSDGRFFGILKVCGRWSLSKHSLKTRKIINRLSHEKEIIIGYKDPVRVLISYLEEKAKESKRARNQLARILAELGDEQSTVGYEEDTEELESYQTDKDDWISFRTAVYD